jgi:hypothetical protein
MQRSALSYQAGKAAAQRFDLMGVDVEFRGATVRVLISPDAPSLDLATGGFHTKQLWKIRMPATISPAPAPLERITTASGRYYVVTSCIPATGAPQSREHVVQAEWS